MDRVWRSTKTLRRLRQVMATLSALSTTVMLELLGKVDGQAAEDQLAEEEDGQGNEQWPPAARGTAGPAAAPPCAIWSAFKVGYQNAQWKISTATVIGLAW